MWYSALEVFSRNALYKFTFYITLHYKNEGTNFFRFVTQHAFDRQMDDGWTDRKALQYPCAALYAVAR